MAADETKDLRPDRTQQFPRTFAIRQSRRVAVAVAGGLCIAVAVVIVPIPGPWSIALSLVGLTILSWEFHWARRLLYKLKARLKQLRARPRSRKG